MAYIDRQSGTSRIASIATVGVIHAAIGAILIYGFAVDILKIVDTGPLTVINVPVAPPPPPPPRQIDEAKPIDSIITAPPKPIELTPRGPDIPIIVDPLPPTGTFTPPVIPMTPPSQAAYSPKSPVPANDISGWVTNSDYPSAPLRREEQGTSRFRVVVGTDGRVKSCEITASSGSQQLDEATCKLVIRRAKFEPARDESGQKIMGIYSSSVRWQIPG